MLPSIRRRMTIRSFDLTALKNFHIYFDLTIWLLWFAILSHPINILKMSVNRRQDCSSNFRFHQIPATSFMFDSSHSSLITRPLTARSLQLAFSRTPSQFYGTTDNNSSNSYKRVTLFHLRSFSIPSRISRTFVV